MMKGLLIAAGCLCGGIASANAATLNVDYYDFEGRAFVESNPVSKTCAADDLAFGSDFTVVYRFNTGTNVVSDALAFVSEHGDYRVNATNTPFSLNGNNVPVDWDTIDSRAFLSTGNASTSSLTITPAKIVDTTQYVEITGTLNDFLNVAGCTVNIRAGLVRRPN
jgi:hypothetical protein